MRKIMCLLVSLVTMGAMAQSKIVKGIVSQDGVPLENVTVSVSDLDTAAMSSREGMYQIEANVGDRITYLAPNMKPLDIIVEDVTTILNVEMVPSANNTKIVTQRNRTGTVVGSNEDNEASSQLETTVTRAYMSRLDYHNFNIGTIQDLNINRENSSTESQFVDGMNFDGNLVPHLPFGNHADHAAPVSLVGIALFDSYGVVGANTLYGNNTNKAAAKHDANPIYDRAAVTFTPPLDKTSNYLRKLKGTASLVEAKAVYASNATLIANSYHFVLDAMQYFIEEHRDVDYAQTILQDGYMAFETNPVALKALAYLYEANNLKKEANSVYKEVFSLRPSYGQSYVDLARSYSDIGEYNKAATMFSRIYYLEEQGFLRTSPDFNANVNREFDNLLLLKGAGMMSGANANLETKGFEGTRIVVEWADSETEFDLQLVNPKKEYEIWPHTLAANQERINEEKTVGYQMQEYLIGNDAAKGIWKLNMNYKGNKQMTPSYLKATVYHNYGSKFQSKEVRVFKLQKTGVNQNLLQIQNGSLIVSK